MAAILSSRPLQRLRQASPHQQGHGGRWDIGAALRLREAEGLAAASCSGSTAPWLHRHPASAPNGRRPRIRRPFCLSVQVRPRSGRRCIAHVTRHSDTASGG